MSEAWMKFLGAAVAAIIAAGLVFKFVFKSKKTNVTNVEQKGNIVGGDNAGRDIKK